MAESPDRSLSRWGLRLVLVGAILLAAWASLEFIPMEEPASPGKTPNPSKSPWNVPVPAWEYSLARGLVVLGDYGLPIASSLAFALGIALLLVDLRSSRTAPALLGALVLLAGLSLLGTTAWLWHVRTAFIEPARPGRTPEHDSSFFMPFEKRSPGQTEASFAAQREEERRRERLDRLWGRIVLYSFPPMGIILSAVGVWLLTARPPSGRDS